MRTAARFSLVLLACVLTWSALLFAQRVTLVESTLINLLRGSTTIETLPSWDACLTRARQLANADPRTTGTVTYTCQTERRRVVASYSSAPTPVDCVVSDWSCTAPVWGACVNGTQTGTQSCTRTVLTPSSGGGAACPALTETRTVTQACVVTPDPDPDPADVVFRDNFDYVVGRSDTAAPQLFLQRGWSGAKTQQTAPGARGYLYTTTTVPGYSGPLPGGGSHVLAIEMLPQTLGSQTDAYLQLGGSGTQYEDHIPGDVWIQYWIFLTPESQFGCREKFFYVCNTDYPCHSHLWMLMTGACSYDRDGSQPFGFPSVGQFLYTVRPADGVSQIVNGNGDPSAPGNLGQTNPTPIRAGTWYLVKHHFRTMHESTGNAWETWIRPMGGAWVKVAEHISGTTPNLTWNIPAASVGGHRVFRWPTTQDYDKRMYFDDFVMARTEAALPVYP